MRARTLAAPFPVVGLDTPAIDAARLLAGQDLPVVDPDATVLEIAALLDRMFAA